MRVVNVLFFQKDKTGNLVYTRYGTDLDSLGGVVPSVGDLMAWYEPGLICEIQGRYLSPFGDIPYVAYIVDIREPTEEEMHLVDAYNTQS